MKHNQQGLVLLNTGRGKGKTTAALGLMLRAWGHDFSICVIQFMKSEQGRWGEVMAAEKMEIEWHIVGEGFTWKSDHTDQAAEKANQGWTLAREKISSGQYDLVILDEFTYPLHYRWLDTKEVIRWLQNHKPPQLHLVMTGRHAPQPLIDYADTVTEMQDTKHAFDQGHSAQTGIEY